MDKSWFAAQASGTATSSCTPAAPHWDPDDPTGTLRGLDRDVYKTEGLEGLERATVIILRDLTDALLEEALG